MPMVGTSRIGGAGDAASPLKLFTNAKKRINGIYEEIGNYLSEFNSVVKDLTNSEDLGHWNQALEQMQSCSRKVQGIKDMLIRNHMKVVFFGRTSNGKSTVINAMLWDKILPSGLGHTTNCFLSVEGCDDRDGACLHCSGSDEKQSVESVSQLGHALSQESMSSDCLISIRWPKHKCALLKHEVILLDSPGIDVTEDMDKWIDKYCLDADVFILVANAESTLMLAEKNFFHKVNERLSKPNIFILNNRWDASAAEPELVEKVRQQHLERGISFLSEELGVVSAQQARDRVFFISAKEALNARLQKLQGMPEAGGALADGFQARLMEFNTFEHNFEECISQSATRTKFQQHAECAQDIVQSFLTNAKDLLEEATRMKVKCDERYEELEHKLSFMEKELKILTNFAKDTIAQLINDTECHVRQAMYDEIRQLSLLVDEFDRPFHQNPMVLQVYKVELYRHVEEGLERNLSTRCSGPLMAQISQGSRSMIDKALPLLECGGATAGPASDIKVPSFSVSYNINCANLCSDFHENIQFKFSLGLRFLGKRFLGMSRLTSEGLTTASVVPDPFTVANSKGGCQVQEIDPTTEDILWSLATSFFKLRNPQSASLALGIVMVPYALWRTIGWRALVFLVVSYSSLYLYERLTWTTRAQEKALKRQFIEHATEKLNLISTFTSSNCSHQVQKELSGTFCQIIQNVDKIIYSLQEESKKLKVRSERLSKIQSQAKTLRNKAGFIMSSVEGFIGEFLTNHGV